jgi:3-deoxy-D-manno-octulosonic-acid transferase
MMALLYNLALLFGSPLLAVYLLYRLVIQGKSREGFAQRLGLAPELPPAEHGRVWLHAVSAGEVVAAATIARRLEGVAPDLEVVISTTTPAGQQQARKLLPQARAHFYFPFDFLPCVASALARVRPTVVAPVETEIWPNWLWLARRRGLRAALLNGQFADKGFRGARRARTLYGWALSQLDALLMQTGQAAERARFLGAPAERVRVTGNVKFEQEAPPLQPEVAEIVSSVLDLRRGRPLVLAGSTHPGEEEQVLEAFRAAREQEPELALLLAPRHVQRAQQVGDRAAVAGWHVGLRSERPTEPLDVLVLDTMGELASLYALADVVFVGGSLVPIGGHDILQPLFFGKPVLFGRHMHNQHELAALALDEGAAVQVADAGALGAEVLRCLREPDRRAELKEAGGRLLQKNRGAAQECATLLASLADGTFQP